MGKERNPYLPKTHKTYKAIKAGHLESYKRKKKKDNIKGKKVAPRIAMQPDPSRIDPKYFLSILSPDWILPELELR